MYPVFEVETLLAEARGRYGTAPTPWMEVLVDCPGAQGLYTYQVPPDLEAKPGDIVSVPFGAQQIGGVAIRWVEAPPEDLAAEALRPIEDVVSRAFFPSGYWDLIQQVAAYYHTPLMQVLRTVLPPGLLRRSQRRIRLKADAILPGAVEFLSAPARQIVELLEKSKTGHYTWQYLQRQVRNAQRGLRDLQRREWVESYLEPPEPVRPKLRQAVTLATLSESDRPSTRQREVLEVLRRRGGEMWLQELLQACHTSSSTIKRLEEKGWVVIQEREVLRSEAQPDCSSDRPKTLTPDQTSALTAIQSLQGNQQVLLHGVTGSGKTEVYLQAIAPVLERRQSALVLVPEIGLTPQLTDRFRARFGDRVQVYHSALSDGERYDTWRQMLLGHPQVVIGTRSAIFAPLPNLGLIVLDEEHDGSFKQDQPAPCYHARTVAQWRSAIAQCPLILGSATPSLESWVLSQETSPISPSTSSQYLSLPRRVQDRPLPPIQIVDMRQELQQGNRSIFSRSLQAALMELQERRSQGHQGLLFIPRRGHSTFVSCRSCGFVIECPHCDISLTYHQPNHLSNGGDRGRLQCHYCGHGQAHPSHCPDCGSPYLKHFGSGTQRVVEELAQQLPDLRCIRFDSDTTRARGAHRTLLNRFAQGEADLLVGTQMLTKGIDLPQVTLVGIVAADGLLHLADYRASERTFQSLTQVAGRAGRGDEPGQVILQTYSPQHPVIQAVQQHDFESFAAAELKQRQELSYPPYGHLILVRISSPDQAIGKQTAEQIAAQLSEHLSLEAGEALMGPVPAVIFRVARRFRWQILLKGSASLSQRLPDLEKLRSLCPAVVSLTVDIDPLSVL